MKHFILNKLVRDKIEEIILNQFEGNQTKSKILKGQEKVKALINKLNEESLELKKSNDDEIVSELCDVQSIINALIKELGLNPEDFKVKVQEKDKKAGGFDKGIFIEEVSLGDKDKWVSYYQKQYKEIKK